MGKKEQVPACCVCGGGSFSSCGRGGILLVFMFTSHKTGADIRTLYRACPMALSPIPACSPLQARIHLRDWPQLRDL